MLSSPVWEWASRIIPGPLQQALGSEGPSDRMAKCPLKKYTKGHCGLLTFTYSSGTHLVVQPNQWRHPGSSFRSCWHSNPWSDFSYTSPRELGSIVSCLPQVHSSFLSSGPIDVRLRRLKTHFELLVIIQWVAVKLQSSERPSFFFRKSSTRGRLQLIEVSMAAERELSSERINSNRRKLSCI